MRQAFIVLTLISVFQLLATIDATAQSRSEQPSRFGLSVIAGLNLSQIDGDNFKGYNKPGFVGGLRGIVHFSPSIEMQVELLYSQKGSKFESAASARRGERDRKIALDYAEIPLLLAWNVNPEEGKVGLWVKGGFSIARLLSSEVVNSSDPSDKEFDFESIEDQFEKTDWNAILGVGVDPTEYLGFELRFTTALTKFYESPTPGGGNSAVENVEFLRNYHLSLMAMYHF